MEQELPINYYRALYILPFPYNQFSSLLHFAYFYIVERKDEDMGLTENEFTVSIYRQPHFKQRSEKLLLHIYICQDQCWGYGMLCSYATNALMQ